jgi:hypothetical protein
VKRITDPSFNYVPAVKTDIAKTFRRIRREQAVAARQEAAAKVQPIRKVAAK